MVRLNDVMRSEWKARQHRRSRGTRRLRQACQGLRRTAADVTRQVLTIKHHSVGLCGDLLLVQAIKIGESARNYQGRRPWRKYWQYRK